VKPKQSIKHIALDQLIAHGSNRDLTLEATSDMADSMREHGVISPLVVTEHPTDYDRWLILDGHHRAAAARLAGIRTVPCVIRHDLDADADEQLVVMLVANCQRTELAPMERAEMLGVLRDKRNFTLAEIARRTGLSASRVSESLSLLELDAETREAVRTGDVGVGTATQAIRQVRAANRTGALLGKPQAKRSKAITVEAAHFTSKHPLAGAVRKSCEHLDASAGTVRPTVGGIACGQCWERTIRDDERARIATGEGISA